MIRIEPESEVPIYTQLTNQIIQGIVRGEIQPGDSLPSVRSFAADLGVNMHTVNKSYHELEKKGVIRIVPKSGAVIATHDKFDEAVFQRIMEDIKPQIAEALVFGIDEEKIQMMVKTIIEDFKINNPR